MSTNRTLCKGRYDVSTQSVRDEFNDLPLQPILSELMKCCLTSRYVCSIGILVTNSNSDNGPWHRYDHNLCILFFLFSLLLDNLFSAVFQ